MNQPDFKHLNFNSVKTIYLQYQSHESLVLSSRYSMLYPSLKKDQLHFTTSSALSAFITEV